MIKTFSFNALDISGLTVCMSAISGDFTRQPSDAVTARGQLRKSMDAERVKGFADAVVSRSIPDALSQL